MTLSDQRRKGKEEKRKEEPMYGKTKMYEANRLVADRTKALNRNTIGGSGRI